MGKVASISIRVGYVFMIAVKKFGLLTIYMEAIAKALNLQP
jgi:hypothetical protein